jgi:hypothetical protein
MSRTTTPETTSRFDSGQPAQYGEPATTSQPDPAVTARSDVRRRGHGNPWLAALTLGLASAGLALGVVALASDDVTSTPSRPPTTQSPSVPAPSPAPPDAGCLPQRFTVTAC